MTPRSVIVARASALALVFWVPVGGVLTENCVWVIQRLSNHRGGRSYTGVALTTTLDSPELQFLIRQIDEYIQVAEFMIR
jgi:hypothetical protein